MINSVKTTTTLCPTRPTDQPDAVAVARLLGVRPVLCGVERAADALGLTGRVLLHAGPPVADVGRIALPLRHSLLLAILYEGWAASRAEAEQLLDDGAVMLRPAQDYRAAVPLADVLSPGMAVLVAANANAPECRAFSTLNGGDGPVMRVGVFSSAVLARLTWINRVVAPAMRSCLANGSVDLVEIADRALCAGDDCHGRTQQASMMLAEALLALPGARGMPDEARTFIQAAPAFFLNPWMAAVKCMLLAAQDVAGSSMVTAMGGNGNDFGIQVAAWPGRWFVAPGTPPHIPGVPARTRDMSLGAIGDSAIVDAVGCGAMAWRHAPAVAARLYAARGECGQHVPVDLLATLHPGFARLGGLLTGLLARRAQTLRQTPVVSLGVLDRHGESGRLDGGFYFCPQKPFDAACKALEERA